MEEEIPSGTRRELEFGGIESCISSLNLNSCFLKIPLKVYSLCSYILLHDCEISHFVKCLIISVISWSA